MQYMAIRSLWYKTTLFFFFNYLLFTLSLQLQIQVPLDMQILLPTLTLLSFFLILSILWNVLIGWIQLHKSDLVEKILFYKPRFRSHRKGSYKHLFFSCGLYFFCFAFAFAFFLLRILHTMCYTLCNTQYIFCVTHYILCCSAIFGPFLLHIFFLFFVLFRTI